MRAHLAPSASSRLGPGSPTGCPSGSSSRNSSARCAWHGSARAAAGRCPGARRIPFRTRSASVRDTALPARIVLTLARRRHRQRAFACSAAPGRRCRSGIPRGDGARRAGPRGFRAAVWVRRTRRSNISTSSSRLRMRAWRTSASSRVCRLPVRVTSSRSPTSSAAASAANWRSLVWAMPSSRGSGSIRPPQPVEALDPEPTVVGVAGPASASGD